MDLPTCKSCGQSVLDDSAVDCPFCGAPMKGGTPGKPKPQPAKPAAGKPAAGSGPKGIPGKQAAAPAGEDDPFAVDSSSKDKAVLVSPKSAGGKTLAVKCPMCEAEGFVSPKFAGQLVKCANPKCLVPLFTAPVLQEEAPPPEPPKKKSLSPNAILFSVVGVVVLGAVGAFFLFFSGPSKNGAVELSAEQKAQIAEAKTQREAQEKARQEAAKKAAEQANTPVNTAEQAAAAAAAAFDKQVAEWPEQMLTAVRTSAANRIASGRRWAGLALASRGNLPGALEQVEQIAKISGAASYEAILPLVAIYWKQVAAGDAAAVATLDRAAGLSSGLPKLGRIPADCRISLATALAHADRHDVAIKVLADGEPGTAVDHLAAAMQIARGDGSFALQRPAWPARTTVRDDRPHRWSAPRTAGVVLGLTSRGHWDAAVKFASAQTAPDLRHAAARTVAIALGLAADLANEKRAEIAAKLLAAGEKSQALKVELLAAQARWDAAGREQLLAQVDRLAESVQVGPQLLITGAKSLLETKLPDQRSETLALALALADAASLHTGDDKAKQRGAALFAQALALARSVAPSPTVALDRKEDIDRTASTELRARLKEELELRTNDAAERKVVEYRAQVERLYKAARERFDATCEILLTASAAGRGDVVRAELERAIAADDRNQSEPYDRSTLPFLLDSATLAGLEPLIEQPLERRLNPVGCSTAILERDAETVAAAELLAAINSPANKSDDYDELGFRRVESLVRAGKHTEAVEFIAAINDLAFQEEAIWLAGAVAGPKHAAELWKVTEPRIVKDQPLRVAAISGLLHGLTAASGR